MVFWVNFFLFLTQDTFFNIETPLSLLRRVIDGDTMDLARVLNGWVPWMTPNGPYQALQQGGLFIFEGDKLIHSYRDKVSDLGSPEVSTPHYLTSPSLSTPNTGNRGSCKYGRGSWHPSKLGTSNAL